jgi:hypothetical protein
LREIHKLFTCHDKQWHVEHFGVIVYQTSENNILFYAKEDNQGDSEVTLRRRLVYPPDQVILEHPHERDAVAGPRKACCSVTVQRGPGGRLSCPTSSPGQLAWQPAGPDPTFVGASRVLHGDPRKGEKLVHQGPPVLELKACTT